MVCQSSKNSYLDVQDVWARKTFWNSSLLLWEICSIHSDFQSVLWLENDWAMTMSSTEPNCAQQNHFCLTALQILEGFSWFLFNSDWPPMVYFQVLSLVWILYHECISGFLSLPTHDTCDTRLSMGRRGQDPVWPVIPTLTHSLLSLCPPHPKGILS